MKSWNNYQIKRYESYKKLKYYVQRITVQINHNNYNKFYR